MKTMSLLLFFLGAFGQDIPVKVGLLVPLDPALGSLATMGQELQRAANVAISVIESNSAYKVDFTLTVADTGKEAGAVNPGDVGSALTTALDQLIITNQNQVLVGAYRSSRSIPSATRCGNDGIPIVSYGSTSAQLSQQGTYPTFFRVVPNDNHQAQAMVALLEANNVTKVGIVTTNDAYAYGIATEFQRLWANKGYELSPRWNETTAFDVDTGTVNCEAVMKSFYVKGTAAVNIMSGVAHDTEPCMDWARQLGMTGPGWNWVGFDGFTASSGLVDPLNSAYIGTVGTGVKMPESTNPLWSTMKAQWEVMYPSNLPWANHLSSPQFGMFDAQVYDALAMIAAAVTNFKNSNPAASAITSAQITAELQRVGLSTPGMGNVNPSNNVVFDTTTANVYDGHRSYEIFNYRANRFEDVGNWDEAGGLVVSSIEWSGGSTAFPADDRAHGRRPLKLGLLSPTNAALGAGLRSLGLEEVKAANVAAHMINNDNRYSVQVEIVAADSGTNPDTDLLNSINNLVVTNNVHGIVGALRSAYSIKTAERCNFYGLAQVSFGSTSNSLSDSATYPNFFRVLPNDDYQAQAMVDFLLNRGIRKVGIIYTTDAYAGNIALEFKNACQRGGIELSPSWDDSYSFAMDDSTVVGAGQTETHAVRAVRNNLEKGTAAFNIISAITHDAEAIMQAALDAGATGQQWVWLGFDGFAASTLEGSSYTSALRGAYNGAMGTNVKKASPTDPLWLKFMATWGEMYPNDIPANGFSAYTAQTYDAVAILSQAATNFFADHNVDAIQRDNLITYLKTPTLKTPGVGNVDSDGVHFDTSAGGFDGVKSYEYENFVTSRWVDVGDWVIGSAPNLPVPLTWPGGQASPPPQNRSQQFTKLTLKTGVLLPVHPDLTGLAELGQDCWQAAQTAAAMINENPNFSVSLNIILQDTGRNQSELQTGLTNIIDTVGVDVLMGAFRSSYTKPSAVRAASAGIPIVSGASTSNELSTNSATYPTFFRVVPNDDFQAQALVDVLRAHQICTAGIIYTDDAYAKNIAQTFANLWSAAGCTLSPAWADSPHFDINTGPANAAAAVQALKNNGNAAVNIFSGVTHDAEAVIDAANNLDMVGNGWVWTGFDGLTSGTFDGSTARFEQLFQGVMGTNVRFADPANSLYVDFIAKMTAMNNAVDLPWYNKDSIAVAPFAVQMYDALAIIAQAATNHLTANPGATSISGAQLVTALQSSSLQTPGMGNLDGNGMVKFDTRLGSYDGQRSYEILNLVGDSWNDVGDWSESGGYHKTHDIVWPGGKTSYPADIRGGAPSNKMTLTTGVLLPVHPDLAGLAELGQDCWQAAQTAAAMINANPDFTVGLSLVLQDTGRNQTELQTGLTNIINTRGADVLMGAFRSSYTKPSAVRAAQANIPIVSGASTSNELSTNAATYPTFFRVVPNDDYQAQALVAVLRSHNICNVGMIYTDDAYAKNIAQTFAQLWANEQCTLSPTWDNTPHFDINTGPTNAAAAVQSLKNNGLAAVNIFSGVTHDAEAVIDAANAAGMVGPGWIWTGFDGITSGTFDGATAQYEALFQGVMGTNVKFASATNPLYIQFISTMTSMFSAADLPWYGKNSLQVAPFAVQMYDALAMIAQAATNHLAANPGATNITGTELTAALKDSNLQTPGMGNLDANGNVKFDTRLGSYDGQRSYEVLNLQGDTWADVGDWSESGGFHKSHDVVWPGGQTASPSDMRVGQKRQLKLGLLSPTNAGLVSLRGLGLEEVTAAQVAATMINNNPNYKVEITVVPKDSGLDSGVPDDQLGSPGTELRASIDALINAENVHAIVGALRSSRSIATAQQCAYHGLAQVSYGSTSNALSDRNTFPNFFRVLPNDDYQAQAMIKLLEYNGITQVGIVYTTDAYAGNIALTFKNEWLRRGYTLSPSWESSQKFGIHEAGLKADGSTANNLQDSMAWKAVEQTMLLGNSALTIVSAITDDSEIIMEAARQQMATGTSSNRAWLGFDGFTSSSLTGASAELKQAYMGAVGTNVKMPSPTNSLFLTFEGQWASSFPSNIPSPFSPYTAQVYDSLAIIAQAATNYFDANTAATTISRGDLLTEMKKSSLTTPGIGNLDTNGNVKFDTSVGGYDGQRSYEFLNYKGSWADVGDWIYPNTLEWHAIPITWPNNQLSPPNQVIPGSPVNPSGKQLVLGLLSPTNSNLGAGLRSLGLEEVVAAQVAAALINADPNYGVQVTVIPADSGQDSGVPDDQLGNAGTQLRASIDKLIGQDNVHAIVGALRSSRSIATATQCRYHGLAQVSYGSTSNALSDATTYPNFFRVLPNDDYQAQAMVAILEYYNITQVGIIYTTDAYAGNIAQTFANEWTSRGYTLSPSWADSQSFGIHEANLKDDGTTATNIMDSKAYKAVQQTMQRGSSSINIIAAITDDSEIIMEAARQQSLTGPAYSWLGFDGFTSSSLASASVALKNAYRGALGTNVKMANPNSQLFREFQVQWGQSYQTPGTFLPYTAQVYDSIAILAQAATNYFNSNPSAATIGRAELLTAMKSSTLQTPGLGNLDTNGNVKFDTTVGGYDGQRSYEFLNYKSSWDDVGDWIYPNTLELFSSGIEWSSGVLPPPQASPNAGTLSIKVGVLLPLNQDLKGLYHHGKQLQTAAMVAADMINANSAYKVNFQLVFRDTGIDTSVEPGAPGSDLKASLDALISTENVDFIVGAYRSSRTVPSAVRCASDNIALISACSTSNELSDSTKYPTFFRVIPNDDFQAAAMVAFLQNYGFSKVGLVYTTDAYAQNLAIKFNELWGAAGGQFSPSWANSPKFAVDTGETNAAAAMQAIANNGDSSVTVFSGVTHDLEALIDAANNLDMVGAGWVWLGFDGFTSSTFQGATLRYRDLLQGSAGTNVRYPSTTNQLFLSFVQRWEAMYPNDIPWTSNDIVPPVMAAQMYDALAIAAQAITNHVNNNNAASITRAQIVGALKNVGLSTPGMGNIDTNDNVVFDKSAGGYDGLKQYEILNLVGNDYRDIGDWKEGVGLEIMQQIIWPGGKTANPPQARPMTGGGSPNNNNDDDSDEASVPAWATALIIISLIIALCAIVLIFYIYYLEKRGKFLFGTLPEAGGMAGSTEGGTELGQWEESSESKKRTLGVE